MGAHVPEKILEKFLILDLAAQNWMESALKIRLLNILEHRAAKCLKSRDTNFSVSLSDCKWG